MGGLENDEVSNSLVMKEEKYEAPFYEGKVTTRPRSRLADRTRQCRPSEGEASRESC